MIRFQKREQLDHAVASREIAKTRKCHANDDAYHLDWHQNNMSLSHWWAGGWGSGYNESVMVCFFDYFAQNR